MKKIIQKPDESRYSLPGVGLSSGPKVLMDTIQDMAPELLAQPEFIGRIRQLIFHSSPLLGTDPWPVLKKDLERKLSGPAKKNLDIFLTILEGMKVLVDFHHMKTPEELDFFLEHHQEAFLDRILPEKGSKSSDWRPKPKARK